jgi:hypothetical protein
LNPEVSTSTAKVRIAPTTNRKMLKPIPAVTPPQTLRVCRQGCYRQVMPSSDEAPRASLPLRPRALARRSALFGRRG